MRKKRTNWTEQKIAVLIQLYPIETTTRTAEVLGMCERAVKEKARSLGLKKAVKSRWMEHADYVRNHFAHRSYAEIGKELGISREYARRIAVRMGLKRTALEDFKVLSRIHSDIMRRERRRVIFGLSPITRIKVVSNRARVRLRSWLKSKGYIAGEEYGILYYTDDLHRIQESELRGAKLGFRFLPYPSEETIVLSNLLITTAMTYGQVILILFVVLIGYYGFLIFMDIQHLKAAEAAAQENQSEEEIDITDEARSFQPQQVIRDDKKKEEEKKQEEAGNENDSNTDKQQTTSDEQPNENASSESGEDVSNPEASTATEQSDIPVPAENPSSETVSQTQTAEPDNTDATSASDATDEDEIEDTTHADAEAAPSEAGTSTGSNFSPSYREPILTDGILVDDIFKAIDQLAETGECDLGTIIYHCESMRYAG